MSRTLRSRTVGYDNTAVGSASGTERVIDGAAAPSETYGGQDNIAVGSDPGLENISVGTDPPAIERVSL